MRSFRLFLLLSLLLLSLPGARADSLSEWIEMEQTRIDRTVDENKIMAPDIAGQAQKYRPESRNWFTVKSIWVPEEELHTALQDDAIPKDIQKIFVKTENGKRYFRLFIHPESENFYQELIKKHPPVEQAFEATSTASSRTVVMRPKGQESPVFFTKLSLDVELGGVRRTVPAGEVARSVGTSRYLKALEAEQPSNFSAMREVVGISPKGWERGGMIVRLVPDSVIKGDTKLVPLFSLYAKDANGRSLLQDMAEKAGMDPSQFVKKNILEPFYKGWVEWNINGAVTMEAHAQNVLLELDREGKPTGRFVHRDLGGFNIDTNSPFYKQRAALDVFSTLEKDYHQGAAGAARKQSLYTYFDGGFLHNVDKELTRIQTGYRSGSLIYSAYEILGKEFTRATGLSADNFPGKKLAEGRETMDKILNETIVKISSVGKEASPNKASIAGCALGFFRLWSPTR
jgi:hypothetical protein